MKFEKIFNKCSTMFFFILTILISWGSLLLVLGPDGFLGKTEVPENLMPLTYLAMISGTTTSGLLLIFLVYGKNGIKDLLSRLKRWKIEPKWYLTGVFTAPIIFMTISLLLSIFSSEFLPSIFVSDKKLMLIIGSIAGGLMAGFFEELGWTGFAIPRLRKSNGILKTGLIVGIIWGIWHMPLFLTPISGSIGLFVILLLVKLVTHLPAYRVIMTLVYDNTNSLFLAILMHISLTTGMLVFQPVVLEGISILIYNLIVTGAIWVTYFIIKSNLNKEKNLP